MLLPLTLYLANTTNIDYICNSSQFSPQNKFCLKKKKIFFSLNLLDGKSNGDHVKEKLLIATFPSPGRKSFSGSSFCLILARSAVESQQGWALGLPVPAEVVWREVTRSQGGPLADPSGRLLFRTTAQGSDGIGSWVVIVLWLSPLAKPKHG